MRFYELNSGTIYVDGQDIKNYKRSDLRSLFGMVLQDAWLFNGTVMENLRYGRLDATDQEVTRRRRQRMWITSSARWTMATRR